MREVQGRWSDLHIDSYLRDKQGTVWRICAEDRGWFRAKNRQGDFTTLSPKPADTPVTILEQTEADCIPLLRDALGARVVATKPHSEKVWQVEGWPEGKPARKLDDYKEHLESMHRVYAGDIKTYVALQEAHHRAHEAETDFGKRIPHEHV